MIDKAMNQRMSLDEVQEVVRLASQRRFVPRGSGPNVMQVADALGLPPGQVETLLGEVRDRKDGLLPPDRSHLAKPVAIGFGIAALLCLLAFVVNVFRGVPSSTPFADRASNSGNVPTVPVYGAPQSPRVAQQEPLRNPTLPASSSAPFDSGLSSGRLETGGVATKDTQGDLRNAVRKAEATEPLATSAMKDTLR